MNSDGGPTGPVSNEKIAEVVAFYLKEAGADSEQLQSPETVSWVAEKVGRAVRNLCSPTSGDD